MDQIHHRDKPLEKTAKLTAKAGPKPWDIKQYTYQEPIDDQRPLHGDPRLEVAPQSHGPHQEQFDSDFSSSDADHEYGYPVSSSSFTPEYYARTSTASDLGTLAGSLNDKEIDAKYYGQHSPDNSPNGQGSSREATRKKHRLLYPPRKSQPAVSQWHNQQQQQKAAASKQRDSQAQSNKGQASHRKSK